jgi:cell wall assembly regulator SMI1
LNLSALIARSVNLGVGLLNLNYMETVITRLDEWLKSNRADYYAQLLPGATDEEIQRLERLLGLSLPESFKALYRWRNGQPLDCYEAFHDNKMFLRLEEIEETWVVLKELLEGGDFEIENWWRVGWVPFLHDGAGNNLCLDLEGTFTGHKGQLLEFWHDDFDRDVLYPDFKHYLEAVVECLEQNMWSEKEEFWGLDNDCIERHNAGYPKRITLK